MSLLYTSTNSSKYCRFCQDLLYTSTNSKYCRFCQERIILSQGVWKAAVKLAYVLQGRWIGDPTNCSPGRYHEPR